MREKNRMKENNALNAHASYICKWSSIFHVAFYIKKTSLPRKILLALRQTSLTSFDHFYLIIIIIFILRNDLFIFFFQFYWLKSRSVGNKMCCVYISELTAKHWHALTYYKLNGFRWVDEPSDVAFELTTHVCAYIFFLVFCTILFNIFVSLIVQQCQRYI